MTTFDRHALGDFMKHSVFAAKVGSIEATDANPYKDDMAATEMSASALTSQNAVQFQNIADVSAANEIYQGTVGSVKAQPMYTDELMPFDSTLAAANEYGQGSHMRVFAIEILNEGSGISIDDTSNEVQMTYIARMVHPWVPVGNISQANPQTWTFGGGSLAGVS